MSHAGNKAQEVLATLYDCWEAYDAGTQEFFDFFTQDASVFSSSFPTRFQGLEAYRSFFSPQLASHLRGSHIFDPEVRLVGEGAVVSFHSRVRTQYNSLDSRMTLLLVPAEGGRLKIAHMHISLLGSPPATGTSGLKEDIAELPEPGER
jgi:ketosteroid isomerase-like protein